MSRQNVYGIGQICKFVHVLNKKKDDEQGVFMKHKAFLNVLTGVVGQVVILVLGFVIPRLMIHGYGSDTNGLLSTITQIFTYMALLEAGIGQAARNALYKPIVEGDRDRISYISSVAQAYFRRISIYYFMGVIILALVLPRLLKSNVDPLTISLITLLQGMSGVISFYFIQTKSVMLVADGKGYIYNGINVLARACSYLFQILFAIKGLNIVFVQVSFLIITIIKVLCYRLYFRSNYSWLNSNLPVEGEKLNDRNAYIVTEIAWTMFSSTDLIVLSVFVDTRLSSIYSVYSMVYSGINAMVNAVYSNLIYLLGQYYHRDRDAYMKLHDAFNSIFFGGMTSLMSVTYLLIIPFIKLYTEGADINYVYNSLPLMFCLVQIISWSRYISGNLTCIAGYAKPVSVISLIEAITNIVLSIILVRKFGINGVLFATVIALPIKVIYCTYVTEKIILGRSIWNSMKILLLNYCLFGALVLLSKYISIHVNSAFSFIVHGAVLTLFIGSIGLIANCLVNPSLFEYIKQIRKRI